VKKKIALIALPVLALFFAFRTSRLPEAKDIRAPADEFSAGRALEDLRVMAVSPHPLGSAENIRVHDYIVRRLRSMGVETRLQNTVSSRSYFPGITVSGIVRNIAARLPSRSAAPHHGSVVFVCHFDSVFHAPGAGDNGASCASFLETIRILHEKHLAEARNELIFLFSDGEESGLLGAAAFMRSILRERPAYILDFEARGNQGPSALFETTRGAGGLVRLYGRENPHPYGSSLSGALYSFLPNDTDFTVFRKAGYEGLNFAFFHGLSDYHTMRDSVENISTRTIQHHGENVYFLARALLSADLNALEKDEAVYFSAFGSFFAYSSQSARLFAVLTILSLFLILAFAYSRRLVSGVDTVGAIAQIVFYVLLSAAAVFLLLKGSAFLSLRMRGNEPYGASYIRIAVVLLCAAFLFGFRNLSARRERSGAVSSLFAAGLILWGLFLVVVAFALPGASDFFQRPLFFALCLSALIVFRPGGTWSVLLFSLPFFWIGMDIFRDLFFAMSVPMLPVAAALLSFYFILLIPFFDEIRKAWPVGPRLLLYVVFAVSTALAFFFSGFDESHPAQDSLYYLYNSDRRESFWASCDRTPDSWTSSYLGEHPDAGELPDFFTLLKTCVLTSELFKTAKAPVQALDAPRTELLIAPAGFARLRVKPSSDGKVLILFIRNAKNEGLWKIGGQDVLNEGAAVKWAYEILFLSLHLDTWSVVMFYGATVSGIEFEIPVKAGPHEIVIVEASRGLPRFADLPPRPGSTMPGPGVLPSDFSYVSGRFLIK